VRTWEFTARFRTDVEPRADITKEQIEDRIVPYLFPDPNRRREDR
jgi:hypothetical protein